MSNLTYWKNEIADIATQDESGKWYDMETGLGFDDFCTASNESFKISDAAKAARKESKSYGAKALTGSAKQKNWAEQIRADFLKNIKNEECINMIVVSSIFKKAKFWIEARNKSSYEIEELVLNIKHLIVQANLLEEKANLELVLDKANIVIEKGNYDKLTKKRSEHIAKINSLLA
jgi:hypothetical protein